MNLLLDQLVKTGQIRPKTNLILHCGANRVEFDDVSKVKTPRATETWTPIPHRQLIQTVEKSLKANHLTINTSAHSLSHDGARYFGLMEIASTTTPADYGWVLGLRNSHDKRFPAGIVAGMSVFVCDNLSFSGDVKFARKHTRYIVRDLPQLVSRSVGLLLAKWHHQDKRIAAYKATDIRDCDAHDLVIRACDAGVCSNRLIPEILHEWREPRHEAFLKRDVWGLFNAFTESLKGNLPELPKRTEALHGLLDVRVGLN